MEEGKRKGETKRDKAGESWADAKPSRVVSVFAWKRKSCVTATSACNSEPHALQPLPPPSELEG